MNEKQLRKQLAEKKAEYMKLQSEVDRIKYTRQINAYLEVLASSKQLLDTIKKHNLSCDDARFLAEKNCRIISQIYDKFSDAILAGQAKRADKNRARNQRRKNQKGIASSDLAEQPVSQMNNANTVKVSSDACEESSLYDPEVENLLPDDARQY